MPAPETFPPPAARVDPRDLKAGHVVSDRNGYYDSQNIVAVGGQNGSAPIFSVVLHHSENHEGGPGLRLYGTRSTDLGRTWSPLIAIDDSATRQSHDGYQLVHLRPDGSERIFVFYGCNEGARSYHGAADNAAARIELPRSDMQLEEGYYFRFSDDHARSWSSARHVIPVRRTAIDRANPWHGKIIGMFMCDKPSVIDGAVYFAFQKTPDGGGETPNSEVFFLCSRNLLTIDDPRNAIWETLPLGDVGLKPPGGELSLGEEPHIIAIGAHRPGRVFSLWRTETGKLAAAYSSNGGESWEPPFWLTYEGMPLGQGGMHAMKNPRGAITPARLRQRSPGGRAEFVLLFYNNGRTERLGYCGRRVYWITVGRETDAGTISWNQPEIALWWDGAGYEDRSDWNVDVSIVDGPGYPDWLEMEDGSLSFVESNKLAVRYHVVEPRLLQFLRAQPEACHLPLEGKVADASAAAIISAANPLAAPVLPDLRAGGGFTLLMQFRGTREAVLQRGTLISAMTTVTAALGEQATSRTITKGYKISVTAAAEIELMLTDGFEIVFNFATSTAANAGIWDGRDHVVTFIIDGGPRVASVVVDERLDDGGDAAAQGWVFHPPGLGEIGGSSVRLAPAFGGILSRFVVYERALLTTEAIAAARALLSGC